MNNRLEAIAFGDAMTDRFSATSLAPIPGKSFFSLHKSPFYVLNTTQDAGPWRILRSNPNVTLSWVFARVS